MESDPSITTKKRKRSNKRKSKNIKQNFSLGEDEQAFNDGDGLIESDGDHEKMKIDQIDEEFEENDE